MVLERETSKGSALAGGRREHGEDCGKWSWVRRPGLEAVWSPSGAAGGPWVKANLRRTGIQTAALPGF